MFDTRDIDAMTSLFFHYLNTFNAFVLNFEDHVS